DGRYSITDEEGKYHFEGVPPGSHVVQMDAVSVPAEYEPAVCKDRVRHAGRAYSQFVDLRGGALWRADFVLARKQPTAGIVNLNLRSALRGDLDAQHTAAVVVNGNDVANLGLMTMLPPGLKYVPGSAQLDGAKFADPSISDDMLIFKLGATPAGAERLL